MAIKCDLGIVVKICNIIAGLCLIILGVFSMINLKIVNPLYITVNIFVILSGIMIVCFEFSVGFFIMYFKFAHVFIGRIFFYLFMIAIVYGSTVLQVVAVVCMGINVLILIIALITGQKQMGSEPMLR